MRYQAPTGVAYIDGADFGLLAELYVTQLPWGDTVVLRGVGRLIWLLAAQGNDVVETLAKIAGQPPADIAPEVGSFLTGLVDRGLLVEVQGSCPKYELPGDNSRVSALRDD